ncbi:MAG: hypothetical protein LW720_12730 [Pirellula sp.]|nr:hypothetical protein [Pirellula sp.]
MPTPPFGCSCIASDFVVLDGCLNCGAADRRSKWFAVTRGPIGRIAILDRIEYEYEYRFAEYEYEKTREQSGAPKPSPMRC